MGFDDFSSKLSDDDLYLTRKSGDPDALDDEFSTDSLADLFGNSSSEGDLFSSGSSDLFGGSSFDSGVGFNDPLGDPFNDPFGSPFGGGGNSFNAGRGNQIKETNLETDKIFDNVVEFFKTVGFLVIDVAKSFRLRTLDDVGDIGRLGVLVGGSISFLGIVVSLISLIGGFNLKGFDFTLIFTGGTVFFTSAIILGVSVYLLASLGIKGKSSGREDLIEGVDDFLEDSISLYNNNKDDYTDDDSALNMGIFDENYDCFNSDEDTCTDEDTNDDLDFTVWGDTREDFNNVDVEADFNSAFDLLNNSEDSSAFELSTVQKVPILTRAYLYDTFIGLFKRNVYDFDKREDLDRDSDEFIQIKALALKAIASASKKSYEEILDLSDVISITSTLYTYELTIKRVSSLRDTNSISLEMISFFGEDSKDKTISAITNLKGDTYFVVINTSEKHLVTLGDILSVDKYKDFYRDQETLLPCIAGILPNGDCLNVDLKHFESMLIAGKPRSGKSWYVLSLILPLMCFCTPEEVQFLIVDPKDTNLFKNIAKFPHVAGLHTGTSGVVGEGLGILSIFETLINVEGAYRKKLLNEHSVDTIWELRELGVELPVLMVVVDEVLTLKEDLEGDDRKRFDSLLKTIITQLPSLGIKLIMVPHRSQGVIDKTSRTNIAYACAVRAEPEVIKETLDVKKFDIPLLEKGDLAIKLNGHPQAEFARSTIIASSDGEVNKFIMEAVKFWDKLEPTIPDMSSLGNCANKDILYLKDGKGLNKELLNIQDALKSL